MSGQQQQTPDPRALAPSGRPPWYRTGRYRRTLIVGGALAALLITTMVIMPAEKERQEPYHQQPIASRAQYEPPRSVPVSLSQPMTLPPPPVVQLPQPAQLTVTGAAKKDEPRLASISAGVAPLPDYMKPKEAQKPEATAMNGIAYKASTLEGARSFTIADQSLILPPQPITCIMDTMIVTGSSGEAPFQCHLENDVLSPKSITLMEAGTVVFGHYQSLVSEGQDRVIAVTAHARTPNGVVVPLGGPIADELGAAGVEGSVDNHWRQRLGGALLLSLLDSAGSLGQAALSKDRKYHPQPEHRWWWAGIAQLTAPVEDHQHSPDHHAATGNPRRAVGDKVHRLQRLLSVAAEGGGRRSMSNTALHHLIRPFLPFLADPRTTEVVVNRPGEFGVEAGTWSWHKDDSLTFERLDAIGVLAAFNSSQEFGPHSPLCATVLPGGERLQVCRPPATLPDVISLTIRKPSERVMRIDDPDFEALFDTTNTGPTRRARADEHLVALYRSKDWKAFFKLAIRQKKTLGVAGSTGSGKTTLLRRCLMEIPEIERIVTIEDTAEFGTAGPPNRVNLFYGDGRANLAAEQVLKASLRMRPDSHHHAGGPRAGSVQLHSGPRQWP